MRKVFAAAVIAVASFATAAGATVPLNAIFANMPATYTGAAAKGVNTLPPAADTTGQGINAPPQPQIGSVPEPAAWGMLIAGFAMTGIAIRRRGSIRSHAA